MERRAEKLDLSAEKVLRDLSPIGFANMLDYVKTTDGGKAYVDFSHLTREQAAAYSGNYGRLVYRGPRRAGARGEA
jgi:hypothetical protein